MNLRRVDRAGNVNSRGERLEEGTQLDNSVAHGSRGRNFWEETIFRGKEKPPGHDRGIGRCWVPGVLNSWRTAAYLSTQQFEYLLQQKLKSQHKKWLHIVKIAIFLPSISMRSTFHRTRCFVQYSFSCNGEERETHSINENPCCFIISISIRSKANHALCFNGRKCMCTGSFPMTQKVLFSGVHDSQLIRILTAISIIHMNTMH